MLNQLNHPAAPGPSVLPTLSPDFLPALGSPDANLSPCSGAQGPAKSSVCLSLAIPPHLLLSALGPVTERGERQCRGRTGPSIPQEGNAPQRWQNLQLGGLGQGPPSAVGSPKVPTSQDVVGPGAQKGSWNLKPPCLLPLRIYLNDYECEHLLVVLFSGCFLLSDLTYGIF